MQRVVRVACVLALIGVGAWLWLSADEGAAPVVEAAPRATPMSMSIDEPAADAPIGTTAAKAGEPTRDETAASAPNDTAPSATSATGAATWSVRMVEAETGAPIAGARVWLVPRSRVEETRWPAFATLVNEPLTILEQETPIGTSRADGTIDVPIPTEACLLAAAAAGRFGGETVDNRPIQLTNFKRLVELKLFRDATVRVEVVDESGTPRAFVPVDMGVRTQRYGMSPFLRVLPDASAVALIRHARWRLAAGGTSYSEMRPSCDVSAGIAMLPDFSCKSVEERHLAGETLRLVVPPCAPLRVRLLQADGTPWPHDGYVKGNARLYGQDAAPLRGGDALFDAVNVAPAFAAQVVAQDPRFSALDVAHPGNRTPWVETVLVAQLPKPGESSPTLTGRVLDASGAPVANTEFFVMFTRPSGSEPGIAAREPRRFTTSSDGRFEVPYADARPPARRVLVRTDPSRGRIGFDPRERAEFTLPEPLSIGVHDLGDLVMRPARLLVAGRVETTKGSPVANARVRVEVPDDDALEPATDLNGKPMRRGMPRVFEIDTPADGTFRVYGPESAKSVRVSAHRRSTGLPSIDVAAGRDDVVLVMPTPAWVRGRVLVDDRAPAELLNIQWTYGAPKQVGGRTYTSGSSMRCNADGTFALELESAQPSRISVWAKPGDLVARLEDVQCSEAAPDAPFVASDPRLDPLDLRGRFRVVRGLVLDPDDLPIEGATIWDETHSNWKNSDSAGRFTWLTTQPAPVFEVSSKRYRPVRVTADVDDLTVHLREPAMQLVVKVPETLTIAASIVLIVSLEDPKRPQGKRVVTQEDVERHAATLYVQNPGSYVINVHASPRPFGAQVPLGVTVPVEVKEATPSEVTLPLTQAQLDAMQPRPTK